MNFKYIFAITAISIFSILSTTANASTSGEALAQGSGCFACHKVDSKLVGPSYKDVAKKYQGDKTAQAKLVMKVKKGGNGVWGSIAMPPHPQVKDADLNTIISWILTLK